MEYVDFQTFSKIDLRVGKIIEAEDVPNSRKLIKVIVDLGPLGKRQILSGIKKWYRPEELVGKTVVVVANLKPKKMANLESQGMILMAEEKEGEKPVFIAPIEPVAPGSKIY
ncbi:methionyl-tRNA synthetase [Ignicoccus pacificus DSM 13166]|uniref:Methionine--tRNA ligase n=1 Tax=Ignicoccus pacificus DSM 13166 TaxID=940294 RepID=A0A977K9L8_9CREN|nr:methionyl-tRNA synthetase [Ignicoccus pacificus DSM 13166]